MTRPSIAIVGGGFAGIGSAVMLSREGYGDVTVFERGDRIGGVWNYNTYPGIACDIPSHLYEFSFAPNPDWSRRFSPGHEIRAYMEDVARRHGVLDKVRLRTEVTSAGFDESRARWVLETSAGRHEADVLLTACGQLSVPRIPPIPGLGDFAGPAFHTARWRDDVDLAGKRVALIGTGCSAIQTGPSIQPDVAQLDVYQRSPGWTLPKSDFEYGPRAKRLFRRFPLIARLDRQLAFWFMEFATTGMTRRRWILRPFEAVGRWQINSKIKDPELRRKVTPTDEIGCKRIMLTDDWYSTLAEPNVEVVTDAIQTVTRGGIRTDDGRERPADAIVLATGFSTHGFIAPMEVTGRDGRTLSDAWAGVPKAYLGITVPGFPNMFLLYGPNTNGGAGSVIYAIEAAAQHVIAGLRELERSRARTIEVRRAAADGFDRELRDALAGTVWHSGCANWYVDENGADPNQWPWTWSTYRRRTERVEPGAYELV
ncbi:MAG: NAD(P)/FAD-dependent oxidoreductase [Thermoleophilaceae bacterium]|nr:NAD(P)/FAD-dependent oxidoreductase [Thermoleophilaceae bacterium]